MEYLGKIHNWQQFTIVQSHDIFVSTFGDHR